MKMATLTLSTLLMVLATAGTARTATFLVDSKLDSLDTNPGDGICDDGQGRCTLRAAILETNALPGSDRISLQLFGSPYLLYLPGPGEDLGYEGDLDITGELSITFNLRFQGPPERAIIDGSMLELDRVFDIQPGAKVTIQGVWIENGHALQGGGGIRNQGTLTLIRTKVRDNFAFYGGGIANSGVLTLTESAVFRNWSVVRGGGIDNFFGQFDAIRSEISENGTAGVGGGIHYHGGGGWLVNTTVSGNTAVDEEVGIVVGTSVSVALNNSTVTNHGVGIKAFGWIGDRWTDPRPGDPTSGTVYLQNTIVAKNADKDCRTGPGGVIVSMGHNLDSDDTCRLDLSSDKPGVDPVMYPLGSLPYSPTRAHALYWPSPAIDSGNDATCPALDQRGFPRPADWACDIGSYEWGASAPR